LGKKLCYSVMVLLGNLVHALFALLSFGYSVTMMLGFWVWQGFLAVHALFAAVTT
jgi:hypothetical protein